MNPLRCAFGVWASKFMGFIIHERGIEIDPKKIEAIKKDRAPSFKQDLHKLLGKVNCLRKFMNLFGIIIPFTPILQFKGQS